MTTRSTTTPTIAETAQFVPMSDEQAAKSKAALEAAAGA